MTKLLLLCFAIFVAANAEFTWRHHNNEELPLILEEVHQKCPNITRVYALTEPSVQNVPLYVIEFSDKPGIHQPCKYYFIKRVINLARITSNILR